ncbi:MAG: TIR domain-containing protein [Hyphomicrobiaceae bacterium]|nr:MAG: TIR domain-containing protein [Hyphomicrobiaceae bacterium]
MLWTWPGGYTRLGEVDTEDTFNEIAAIDEGIERLVASERGRVLNAFNSSYCAAFSSAPAAYRAARKIVSNTFGEGGLTANIPMICGIHGGQLYRRGARTIGSVIGTARAVCSMAHNREIVLSDSVAALVRPHLEAGLTLKKLGTMRQSLSELFLVVEEAELAREQHSVFISYRREGGAEMARLIAAELGKLGVKTFIDLDDLQSAHFDDQIYRRIEETPNFLLVLSPGSLDRCREEGDWLHKEVAHALETRRNIVPILMPDFVMPEPGELPPALSELPRYNAVPYSHEYASAALSKLIGFLRKEADGAP